jgi:hypothetical protein
MKKSLLAPRHTGLAILAGALTFMGNASAVTIFSEGFEGGSGAGNAFNAPTYAYSLNYTLPNSLTPAGGNTYATGVSGVDTNTLTAAGSPFSLEVGGIAGSQIDAGLVVFSLSAQFSTYRFQQDYAEVRVTYLDGASAPIGSETIGGLAFVTALASGPAGPLLNLPDARAWATDQAGGVIPAGARTATVDYLATRLAGGAADAYLDNVLFTIDPVPEPSAALSALLAGSALAFRRRRREPK